MQGTITWFKCEEVLPPIEKPGVLGNPSEIVLVYGAGAYPQISYYVHTAKEWFAAESIPFNITHWAYINKPE